MSKFIRGESGNPAGRPRGAVNKKTELSKLLLPYAEQIISKIIGLALNGDMDALKLCIDRLIPKVKNEPINFEMPKDLSGVESLLNNNAAIIKAVTTGAITLEAGQFLSNLLETQHKIIVSTELEQRLKAIEQTLKERQNENR
jgi:hypothetical protein